MDDDAQDCIIVGSEDILKKEKKMFGSVPNSVFMKVNRKRGVRKKNVKEHVGEPFSWLPKFQRHCQSLIGSSSMKELLKLISSYAEYISKDVATSYTKPNRAAKVKKNMIDVLAFFHNHYLNIKLAFDESAYMEKMSALLTMYIDMEIKASRRGKESLERITSKLISALFLILNNSLDYILDSILGIRFAVRSFSEVCTPIFRRVARALETPDVLCYVRCLLMMKVWKRILPAGEERNAVNRLAVATLDPPPPALLSLVRRGFFAKVLPPLPPAKRPDLVTRYFMTAKFNIDNSITELLKISAESRINEWDITRFDEDLSEQENLNKSGNIEDDIFLETVWMDISKCPSPICPDTSYLDDVFCMKPTCNTTKSLKVQKKRKSALKLTELFTSNIKRKEALLKSIKINKTDVESFTGKTKKKIVNKKTSNFPSWHIPIKQSTKVCSDENSNNNIVLENGKSFLSNSIKDYQTNDKTDILDSPEKMQTSSLVNEKTGDFQVSDYNNLFEEESKLVTNSNIISKSKTENKITISCKKFSEISSFPSEVLKTKHQQLLLNDTQFDDAQLSPKRKCNEDFNKCSNHNIPLEKVDNPNKTVPTEDINGGKTVGTVNLVDSLLKVGRGASHGNREAVQLSSKNDLQAVKKGSNIDNRTSIKERNDLQIIEKLAQDNKEPTSPSLSSSEHGIRLQIQSETPAKCVSNVVENNLEIVKQSSTIKPTTSLISSSIQDPKVELISSECMFERTDSAYKSNHSIEKLLISKGSSVQNEKSTSYCELEQSVTENKVMVKKELLLSNTPDQRSRRVINEPQPICTVKVSTDASTTLPHSIVNRMHLSEHVVHTKAQLKEENKQNLPLRIGLKQRLSNGTDRCLLHRILGEGDCSECLTNPDGECNLENRNSVGDNSTFDDRSTTEKVTVERIPRHDDLNRLSSLAKNKEENFSKYDCMEQKRAFNESKSKSPGVHLVAEQDLKTSQNENNVPILSDTEYQYSGNNMTLHDYESEDSNLVIDEDVDPSRELNEKQSEDTNLAVRSISDINEFTSDKQFLDKFQMKADHRDVAVSNNNSANLRLLSLSSEITRHSRILEHEITQRNLASSPVLFGTRSIPTNKPPDTASDCHPNIKATLKTNLKDSAAPSRQESLLLRPPNRNNQSRSSTSNVVKLVDLKSLSAKSSIPKNLPQGNLTYIAKIPTEEMPAVAQKNPNLLAKTKYSNYHPVKTPLNKDSLNIVIGRKVLSGKNTVIFTPKDPVLYESYYHSQNSVSIANTKNIHPVYEQIHPSQSIGSTRYQSLNQNLAVHEKTSSPQPVVTPPYQNLNRETDVHENTHTSQSVVATPYQSLDHNLIVHEQTHSPQLVIEPPYQSLSQNLALHEKAVSPQYIASKVDYVKENSGKYLKQSYVDQAYSNEQHRRNMRPRSKPNIPPDPLCLVIKSKEDDGRGREVMADYEFIRFPVAQEIEVRTADWTGTGASEIGDPDWPVANEHNVDSCNSLKDPYAYVVSSGVGSDTNRPFPNQPFDLQQVSVDFRHQEKFETNEQKEQFNLHVKTLEVDYNLCCSQLKFKEYYLAKVIPATIPVPFPPPARDDGKLSARCQCEQCADNHAKLLSNYNLLTNVRNSEANTAVYPNPEQRDNTTPSFCEKDSTEGSDCSLPLKKRRKLTGAKPSEESETLSYPNTPMISIAQLADFSCRQPVPSPVPSVATQQFVNQGRWEEPPDGRSPAYSAVHPLQGSSLQETIIDRQTRLGKRKPTKRRKSTR